MNKGVMSDQNRGQMSSGVLKASDGQRNFIKREIWWIYSDDRNNG
jgi:hypothetical protein